MITKTKIQLGDIELAGYQLDDGSYAAPNLFSLMYTSVYIYDGCWYCLDPKVPPATGKYDFWDDGKEAFRAFEGNKFCHIFLRPVDAEIGIDEGPVEISYKPMSEIADVIDFCIQLRILPDWVVTQIRRVYDQFSSGYEFSRSFASVDLLIETAARLDLEDDGDDDDDELD